MPGGLHYATLMSRDSSRTSFDKLIADLEGQQEKATLATNKRYEEMMAIFDETIRRYQPGGAFQKSALGQLGFQKTQDVGREMQHMIGSGLYGTTTAAAVPRAWEASVGAPSRLKLEDIMMQRLTQAQMGKAGAIERVEDIGPDYGMIADLSREAGVGAPRSFTRKYGDRGTTGGTAAPSYTSQNLTGTGASYRGPNAPGGMSPTSGMGLGYQPQMKPFTEEEKIAGASAASGASGAEGAAAIQSIDTAATGMKGTPPATASLLSRYSRYKKAGGGASYSDWYWRDH